MYKGKVKSNLLIFVMVFVVLLSLFTSGCTTKTNVEGKVNDTPSPKGEEVIDEVSSDVSTESLTFWIVSSPDVLATETSLNDTPYAKALKEATGINVTYIHPPVGQETEQFNLLVASQQLPDIINWNWISYPGGPQKAINDNVIISLNDILENGKAPNLAKIYSERPEFDKLAKLDNGTYFCFPLMRFDDILNTYIGPVLRKDWLEELGMEPPMTIDEWYNVLKAFKDKKGATAPISFEDWTIISTNAFVGAYGSGRGFLLIDGKVKFGPIEPGYKEYLTLFNKWYQEGLLDPEWITQDRKAIDAKVTGSQTGAYLGTPDSWIGTYTKLMKEVDPNVDFVGVPNPRLNKNDPPPFNQKDWSVMLDNANNAGISTACKNVDLAAKLLDFQYGEEGMTLGNYGIEGESYTLVDGKPIFTELIKENKDGLTMKQAMARYLTNGLGGYPGVQLKDPVWQQRLFPCQNLAIEAWMDGNPDWRIPPVSPTEEESSRFANIMTEVNTYVLEMHTKFIIGQEPLDNYDIFVDNLNKFGIQDAIKINQDALDRFNSR